MNEPKYNNNRFWDELPHDYENGNLCWCDPEYITIDGHLDMIREFGKIVPEMPIPSQLWKHRKEH